MIILPYHSDIVFKYYSIFICMKICSINSKLLNSIYLSQKDIVVLKSIAHTIV